MRGVPLLLIPENIEQLLLARTIATLGAGMAITPSILRSNLPETAATFFGNELLIQRAKAFRTKYKDFKQHKHLAALITRIEQLAMSRQTKQSSAGSS